MVGYGAIFQCSLENEVALEGFARRLKSLKAAYQYVSRGVPETLQQHPRAHLWQKDVQITSTLG